jgi:hypothetical protein
MVKYWLEQICPEYFLKAGGVEYVVTPGFKLISSGCADHGDQITW